MAEAEMKEIELARSRGDLVPLAWMEEQFSESAAALRAAVQTTPVRHGRTVNPEDPDQGTRSLEIVADDLLVCLAEAFQLESNEHVAT
jgi:hypothetical protein